MSNAAPDVTLRVVAEKPSAAAAPATVSPVVIGGLGLLAGLAIAGLVVGLSVGLTKRTSTTNTVTNTTTTVTVTAPLPDWATFPEEHGLWSYDTHAENGPAHWGAIIDPDTSALAYPICADKSTSTQSPIDIDTTSLTAGASVQPNRLYTSSEYKIKPRPGGHPGFQIVANDT